MISPSIAADMLRQSPEQLLMLLEDAGTAPALAADLRCYLDASRSAPRRSERIRAGYSATTYRLLVEQSCAELPEPTEDA